jgi:hypothetical protein
MDILIAGDATGRIVHVAQADDFTALQADYEKRGQPCVVLASRLWPRQPSTAPMPPTGRKAWPAKTL